MAAAVAHTEHDAHRTHGGHDVQGGREPLEGQDEVFAEVLPEDKEAAGYNVVAIPLAAGVLAPWGFTLSPAVGAVMMSASTIIVALNAQLLRRVPLDPDQ